MKIIREKIACSVLALVIAGSAHAGTLVGGGARLPSIGYVGANAAQTLQVWGTNTAFPIAPGSLFGVYQTQSGKPNISYCQAGSSAGKDILAGGTISGTQYNVQNNCVENARGTVTGFGTGLSGVNRSDLTQPNFAAADSPLDGSDYLNYQSSHASGTYPVQFPAVAGAIAIAFNLRDNTGVQVTSSQVNFSDAQLCEIFSGAVSDWSDSRLFSAFTLLPGHAIPAAPINVQYRSDADGTNFGLSNHLVNVCGTVYGKYFETSQAFASVVANFFTQNSGVEILPSNWVGSSGNGAVANAIANTTNSIGYVDMSYLRATYYPYQPIADVNGMSPVANFGSPLTVTGNAVIYNEVVNTTNNANGAAQLEAISTIPGVVNPPAMQCIALVKPALYARPGVPGGIVPSGTYPIVTVSYLLGNAAGNGADLVNTQGLLTAPYTSSITSKVTTIGPGTGLAFLNLGTGAFTASQVSGCLVN